MSELVAEKLTVGYGDTVVVHELSLVLRANGITAIVGPNGSGKSTLLRALARMLKPTGGAVLLDGRSIHALPTKQVARELAVLPQAPEAPAGLTVAELVSFGRYPHLGAWGGLSQRDRDHIREAMALTSVTPFADRPLGTLSGGQRQRAWIAMALAQDAPLFLLDEPTTFLDIAHQFEVLELIRELCLRSARTVAMVLHDINQAARFADHLVMLKDGRIAAQGEPEKIMTPERLREVFGIEAEVTPCKKSGKPICSILGVAR